MARGRYISTFWDEGQTQKVSDIFSNAKLSLFEKEAVWIMESGGKIVWLAGMRSDERFKVTDTTKKIVVVELRK